MQIAGERHWHIGLASTDHSRVAVAVDTAAVDPDMQGVLRAFLVALPLCLVLIGLGGWSFSGRALRPLRKLTVTARQITAEGLDQRISSQGEDREFAELIVVFNGMLERLERSFRQAHRFSADAAHELKTPLAILQGQIEQAIHAVEDGSAMQAELTGILDEVRRLSTISSKLMLLSQADAGNLRIHAQSFDISRALTDLVEDTIMLTPHLLVTGDIQPGLTIRADASHPR
jgi:signal transduction histidine kinase